MLPKFPIKITNNKEKKKTIFYTKKKICLRLSILYVYTQNSSRFETTQIKTNIFQYGNQFAHILFQVNI